MRALSNPIYCGIDTIDLAQATKLIQSIAGGPKPAVGGIKLGLEFFLAHGAPGVRYAFPTPVRATSKPSSPPAARCPPRSRSCGCACSSSPVMLLLPPPSRPG